MTDMPALPSNFASQVDSSPSPSVESAETPEMVQFQWRASCSWVSGAQSRSTVSSYYGFGAEKKHKSAFIFDTDQPELLAAEDNGATPAEHVLVALAGCLTAHVASLARHHVIPLRSVTASVSGSMQLQDVLGINPEVSSSFNHIKVVFAIDADASRDEIGSLVVQAQRCSPMFNMLTNPALVSVDVV